MKRFLKKGLQKLKQSLKEASLNLAQKLHKGRLPPLKVALENELHPDDFVKAGLNKLTKNELYFLNQCLTVRPRPILSALPNHKQLEWVFESAPKKIATQKHFLAIAAIFQNEADFLKEWILYHKLQGVSRFYLYNHYSHDNYLEVLAPFLESGLVQLIEWPMLEYPKSQLEAYSHALRRLENEAEWVALIDVDEFIVPKEKNNVLEFLEEYEDFAGVAINWQLFGTSNLNKISKKALITEELTRKFKPDFDDPQWNSNQFVKCIVRPSRVEKDCFSSHMYKTKENYALCDPDKNPLDSSSLKNQALPINKIQLNHYWFRSEDWFYKNKVLRRKIVGDNYSKERLDLLLKASNEEEDKTIFKFLPALKQLYR